MLSTLSKEQVFDEEAQERYEGMMKKLLDNIHNNYMAEMCKGEILYE